MNEEWIARIANGTSFSAQGLTSADSESWVPWAAAGACTVLLAVVVVFVVRLFSRRHYKGALTAWMKTPVMPEPKVDPAANSEWWTRTQWALEATVSENFRMNDYGLKMLGALAKSEMADTKEKAMLDAVWQCSSTGMQDEAIDQLIADARESKSLSESPEASARSVSVAGDDASASVGRTAKSARRTYDPANRAQVISTLRREILAARLKVTLDKKLGRETPPRVKLLSEIPLPPLVRHDRPSGGALNDGRGPTDATGQTQGDT